MVLDGFGMVWKGLGGFGRGWAGWEGVGRGGEGSVFFGPSGAPCSWVVYFLYIFSGFAIDRSKKCIKTIKNYIKIDAVDPQAAADNPPPPPVTMVRCPDPYNPSKPPKPRQIVRCLRMLTHARSYLNPA